ncbi:MAG: hypothetical protein R3F11_23550 [Verrucomicrobiales bacterium]
MPRSRYPAATFFFLHVDAEWIDVAAEVDRLRAGFLRQLGDSLRGIALAEDQLAASGLDVLRQ